MAIATLDQDMFKQVLNSFRSYKQKTLASNFNIYFLNSVDIEGDTPLNFRQFTGLAHIRDGLIAITSDLVIYMLKFNYNKITNSKDFLTYGNG